MKTALKAALVAFAIAGVVTAKNASAAVLVPICGPRGNVVEQLAQSFEEQPAGYGITADGTLVEILVGPKGTWTILVTRPGGPACLLVHGLDWEPLRPSQTGPVT